MQSDNHGKLDAFPLDQDKFNDTCHKSSQGCTVKHTGCSKSKQTSPCIIL